jgi:LuxR family quorum sensing-dependent transcriptional regulator
MARKCCRAAQQTPDMNATVVNLDGFAWIEELCRLDSVEAIGATLDRHARSLGYTALVFGVVLRSRKGIGSNWPAEWLRMYNECNFVACDLAVKSASTAIAPFTLTEMRAKRPLTASEREVAEAYRDFGWKEGLVVPIHGPRGHLAIAGLGCEERDVSLPERIALQAMIFAAHQRCLELTDAADAPLGAPRLTPREIECLQGIASGRSDWDISDRLSISETTVRFHLQSAKRKFGVRTRAHAVALAILAGYVS